MTPEQIEVLKTADKIVERAERGVTKGRLIHDDEEVVFVRAYVLVLKTLAMMAENAAADHERITQGISPG